ncbi:phytase [Pseudoduganella umbonata]|uniref:Phytase n=1 Tax=Pseudoduganella umbonata TaxID=864828 RepID=A0A4P8HK73_9BURK|nr:phytase [Pseudoduganella umbonata]MBB3220150.1 3-phytase [Pseudoduganella umbonata]QCP10139.1 phytase [Pseudoduganella umbonata]
MKPVVMMSLLATALAAHAQAVPETVPAGVAKARDLAALAEGWLILDKNAVRLVDAAGAERASLPVRGRQLDVRTGADGAALAIVTDANAERVIPLRADSRAGTLAALPALPETGYGIEAACLYRDAQHLTYTFLIGKDGQAEQWLMDGDAPRRIRRLALPPHVQACRVDDATGTLYVAEEGIGVWAYRADAEGAPARRAVALAPPYGKLADGAQALAVVPGGVAAADGMGTLHAWRRTADAWTAVGVAGKGVENLATDAGGRLLARGDGGWRRVPLALKAAAPVAPLPVVMPRAQTEPVARNGDAADDPAIWQHPADPAASRVLGTNKKQGLLVYDLQGRQRQLLEAGRLNNVDVRQDVAFGAERFDLALATRRDDNLMVLFTIAADGTVAEAARLPTELDEIYGACVYRPAGGGLDAFVNDKDGRYLHYRIGRAGGRFTAQVVRRFRTASQPEGCVADEASGQLFVGEERRGLWVTSADAAREAKLTMALPAGGVLKADVEGVGVYRADGRSYVVVSSQGNDSYVVLDATAPYKVRGAFRIGVNVVDGIDGASETDGLEVTSANLGGPYARGMLVVQDGHKRMPDGPQNFKLVAWDDIARALGLD